MRKLLLYSMIVLAAPVWAVDWKPLPSPAEYRATVDLDSVKPQKKFASFTLRRAYSGPQDHESGKQYYSTRSVYIMDCSDGSAALAVTQYYGEDRKLINANVRPNIKRSEFTAPESGSDVETAIKLSCERLASIKDGGPGAAAKAQPGATAKPSVRRSSSGSGIIVTRNGHILTNQHVVRDCDAYEVIDDASRRLKAALQAVDNAKDLALLIVQEEFPAAASLRRDAAPRLGESVSVVGYPLVAVLGTRPSVGFGHVSSTVGVRGNPSQMQISVPVQRGNSGGPVLDQAGNVIGVVVSKLDALKVAQRMGDLPQNVNFAIKGEIVRAFLEAQNVPFAASADATKLENTDIASRGSAVTVRVRCIRGTDH
ncbi:MAG: trypsin-like peptidase domain-containing protein [Betaproteobacteria bacterium]|nr:trypsin-like peptidase domain-containing protein [Betaproteobacteria bacterium]